MKSVIRSKHHVKQVVYDVYYVATELSFKKKQHKVTTVRFCLKYNWVKINNIFVPAAKDKRNKCYL
jgi:hypothetical protein